MKQAPSPALLDALETLLGVRGFSREPATIAPWLTDWRDRYQGHAAALLSPASTQEVQAIVRLCAAHRVALVPQGGNTSMVGGATPPASGDALLLSLRRMQSVRRASAEDNVLIAEAGTILAHVHEAADRIGRRFPLSLGAKGSATVGGLVSTNAGGTQVLRFGTMGALVGGIEAVLPDGSLFAGLSSLKKDNRGFDVGRLLIGAEGTLGIVTAASLRLVAKPASVGVAWVGVATPQAALSLLRHLEDVLGNAVESFELVPGDALDLVLRHVPGTRAPLSNRHDWNALVETTGAGGAADAAAMLGEALGGALQAEMADDALVAANGTQAEALWRLREAIPEAERQQGRSVKHDVSVPVSDMPGFIGAAREQVEARFPGARVIAFGHLGDGNVHFNVQAPPDAETGTWLVRNEAAVSGLVYAMVVEAGGSISAEHGIGQMKVDILRRTADPVRLAVQRAVKAALDPYGIMNPGKLFSRSTTSGGTPDTERPGDIIV